MPTTGAGFCPVGSAFAGFGSPSSVPETAKNIYKEPTSGEVLGGRRIDPVTRDYVIDERGRALGQTEAQQFVYLALRTDLGSSAMLELGNRLNTVRVITDSFEREITDVITSALAIGVQRGLLSINSISVSRMGQSRLFARVRWTDLTTGREQETQI